MRTLVVLSAVVQILAASSPSRAEFVNMSCTGHDGLTLEIVESNVSVALVRIQRDGALVDAIAVQTDRSVDDSNSRQFASFPELDGRQEFSLAPLDSGQWELASDRAALQTVERVDCARNSSLIRPPIKCPIGTLPFCPHGTNCRCIGIPH